MRSRQLTVTLAIVAAVAGQGCSKAFDAYFANPCSHEVRIEIHRSNPEDVDEDSMRETVVIPAGDVRLVEGALGDDSNSVSLPQGQQPFEVHEYDLPHETVVLPATYCEE